MYFPRSPLYSNSIRSIKSSWTKSSIPTMYTTKRTLNFQTIQRAYTTPPAQSTRFSQAPTLICGTIILGILGVNAYKTIEIANRVKELEIDSWERAQDENALKACLYKTEAEWWALIGAKDGKAQGQILKWMQETNLEIVNQGAWINILLGERESRTQMAKETRDRNDGSKRSGD